MDKLRKTPQENKILDYTNQTKNCYGENDKSSRKAIRTQKAVVNRDFRRTGKQILQQGDMDTENVATDLAAQKKIEWKKTPDMPLIGRLVANDSNALLNELQKEAVKRIRKGNNLPIL